jgi:hypothetical protein
MDPIDKCFFTMNIHGLCESVGEADGFRRRFASDPSDHNAEMWARWCENAAKNWRMVSEASGLYK